MTNKEITRRETLLECLEIMRAKWKICSKRYNCLEPKKGMEEQFTDCMEKCRMLQEIIQAMESEPVRRAMADWQREVMQGKRQTGLFDLENG